jgi:hypothetical protein
MLRLLVFVVGVILAIGVAVGIAVGIGPALTGIGVGLGWGLGIGVGAISIGIAIMVVLMTLEYIDSCRFDRVYRLRVLEYQIRLYLTDPRPRPALPPARAMVDQGGSERNQHATYH